MEDNHVLEDDDITAVDEIDRPGGIALEILKELKEQNDRMDEHNKRLVDAIKRISITAVIAISVLVISLLYYLLNFDTVVVDSNGGGYASYIGNDGDVNNYGTNSSEETQGEQKQ